MLMKPGTYQCRLPDGRVEYGVIASTWEYTGYISLGQPHPMGMHGHRIVSERREPRGIAYTWKWAQHLREQLEA